MIWKTKIHYTDTHTEYKTTPKLCIPIINCKTYNRKFKTPNGFISFYIKLTHCLTERLEQGSPFTTGLLFFFPPPTRGTDGWALCVLSFDWRRGKDERVTDKEGSQYKKCQSWELDPAGPAWGEFICKLNFYLKRAAMMRVQEHLKTSSEAVLLSRTFYFYL